MSPNCPKENVLKSVLRLITLALLLIISALALTGCQSGPKHEYPITIEDAKAKEATDPVVAFDEYVDVKNKLAGTDREKAAEALLMAAKLGEDNKRYGRIAGSDPDAPNLSREMKQQIEQRQAEGETKAHEQYKELLKEFAGTRAAIAAKEGNLIAQLEHRIDERNKAQWNYKLIDGLVAMTGRQKGFSYWFALMIIALVVKGVTLPLSLSMYKSQRSMQRLQPAIKALQEKYKDDPQEQQKQVMDFYKQQGVNPFASCFPMLIQLPFMIWIYNTIRLYEFHFSQGTFLWVNPTTARIAPDFLASNMSAFDFPLLVIYTLSMFLTMRLTPTTDPAAAQQQKSMSVMTTGMMFFFFMKYRWSAAFVFYWLILNILSAAQSYYFVYRPNKLNPVVPVALPADTGDANRGNNGAGRAKAPELATSPRTSSGAPSSRPRRPRRPRK